MDIQVQNTALQVSAVIKFKVVEQSKMEGGLNYNFLFQKAPNPENGSQAGLCEIVDQADKLLETTKYDPPSL